MPLKRDRDIIAGFFEDLAHHALAFSLFLAIPAGAGVLVGALSPANVVLCAAVGAAAGFIAWCVWNWTFPGLEE